MSVEETYTDNVTLAPEGQEQWDLVTQINPGLSIRGEGRRLQLNLDYRLQTLFYAEDSDRNDIFHQLQSSATVELLRERFFIDAVATVRQANLFNTGRVARDNISVTGNRTDVVTYEVSPSWRERFGGYADTELRYRRGGVILDEAQVSDSDLHVVTFNAASGQRSQILTWGLDYSYEKEERDEGFDFERQEADAEARYRLGRQFSLIAQYGYADSDFATSRQQGLEDGTYWSLGAGWRPNRYFSIEAGSGENNEFATVNLNPSARTSLTATYRDRAVGSNPGATWRGAFSYQIRRARFQARYIEDTTTTQQVLLERQVFLLTDPFGNPVVDPIGEPVFVAFDLPTLTDEVFVQKRFEVFGGIRLGRKGDVGLTLFSERREFELSDESEDDVGGRVDWTWRLRNRTHLRTGLEIRHTDFRGSSPEDEADDALFEVVVTQDLGRDMDGSIHYSYRERDSSLDQSSFEENRIAARITKAF